MANIPPWALDLFQSLSEDQQAMLVQVGSRAVMDPWFGALASIPLSLQLVYVPHFLKLAIVVPIVNFKYNNVLPRYTNWDESIKNEAISDFAKRAISCHQNAFEAFIVFAPAVLMCRLQKADGKAVRELCVQFLKLRLAYTVLYLIGAWRIISGMRTLVWAASMQTVAALYAKALLA